MELLLNSLSVFGNSKVIFKIPGTSRIKISCFSFGKGWQVYDTYKLRLTTSSTHLFESIVWCQWQISSTASTLAVANVKGTIMERYITDILQQNLSCVGPLLTVVQE